MNPCPHSISPWFPQAETSGVLVSNVQNPVTTVVVYKPLEDKEAEFLQVLGAHWPLLGKHGLVTRTPRVTLRCPSGRVVEIFEWRSKVAAQEAFSIPAIRKCWERIESLANLESLNRLEIADQPFPFLERLSFSHEGAETSSQADLEV
ncbi:MAG: hypothetical protein DWQ01_22400 [Planctomycetota bacterium]|nr:MAG: hypothetical protein DWQ01_22400 [Planctomycetota bacterium]